MSDVSHLSTQEFDTFAGDASLSLVDFWAPWCAPCHALAPAVDALHRDFDGRLRVAKVDIDQAPDLARRFGVRSIPTLMLFRDGKPVDMRVGLQSKDALTRWIESHA
jgi:thioredoxin 1